jgi:hypothetical protein
MKVGMAHHHGDGEGHLATVRDVFPRGEELKRRIDEQIESMRAAYGSARKGWRDLPGLLFLSRKAHRDEALREGVLSREEVEACERPDCRFCNPPTLRAKLALMRPFYGIGVWRRSRGGLIALQWLNADEMDRFRFTALLCFKLLEPELTETLGGRAFEELVARGVEEPEGRLLYAFNGGVAVLPPIKELFARETTIAKLRAHLDTVRAECNAAMDETRAQMGGTPDPADIKLSPGMDVAGRA